MAGEPGAMLAHPGLKLGDEGRTTLLTNGSTLIGIEAIDLALDVE